MGGSSQTIGYWYLLAYHHGICKGPIDAFLEYRGGTKTAWSGSLTASGTINVNKPMLWGGEKDQGGIVGPLNVMFGEAGQMPNSYLVGVFGPETAAWRGMTTVAFEGGKFGAMNPYPQKPSYKVRSITKQWDDDDCWYPGKAPVPLDGAIGEIIEGFSSVEWRFDCQPTWESDGYCEVPGSSSSSFTLTGTGETVLDLNLLIFGSVESKVYEGGTSVGEHFRRDAVGGPTLPTHNIYALQISNPAQNYVLNHTPSAPSERLTFNGEPLAVQIASNATVTLSAASIDLLQDPPSQWMRADVDGYEGATARFAMNPAHMLIYAHTQRDTGRESIDTVNSASAIAAADWFYAQGFGLCTVRRPEAESPAEFRRRIEKVAACSFTRSLADGLYYIDIANGEYDFDSLPILTDDDVLDFKEIPTVLDNAINSVSVKYFDPQRKESIITPPVRALGLIAEFGVIHQTYDYPEIPTGEIAVRVAHRELLASTTPTRAFDLATTRKPYGWRQNTYFRAQLPKRGISDMVCMVGDLQHGQLKSGAIKLSAVQDIYSLPSTVYTEVEFGIDTRPPAIPVPIVDQRAFEAPYMTAVASMTPAEFAALDPDVGFLIGAAADPGRSRNFTMLVAPSGGGAYDDKADGDFCPTALADSDVEPGNTTGIPLTNMVRLQQVEVGEAVLWDDEICRVDAIDIGGATIDLGRGCADTVPAKHLAGSRLFFCDDRAASDTTQYSDGEAVDVKLLTNSFSQQLDEGLATPMAVTFARRIDRPLPPGGLLLNGLPFYETGAIVPGGGSGPGGGTGTPTQPPALTPDGTPASTSLGPNGGYPDNAPYFLPPVPAYAVNLLATMGDFDSPGDLAHWRVFGGASLAGDWTVSDGYMRYLGLGGTAALCYPARYMLPQDNIRYTVTIRATVQSDPGLTLAIGVAFGQHSVAGGLPNFRGTTQLAEYPAETTIEYSAEFSAGSGLDLVNLLPIVVLGPSDSGPLHARLTAWEFIVEPVVIPDTVQTLDHLDFDAGLTGWTKIPALDPADATITATGGVLTHEPESQYGTYTHYVCDDPIDLADEVGKYVLMSAKTWSNDPTTFFGKTVNGVAIGITSKTGGVYNHMPRLGTSYLRGDFTTRTAALPIPTLDVGQTWHVVASLRAGLGYKAKVKDIAVRVTDDAVIP